jgi:hypothetical protein
MAAWRRGVMAWRAAAINGSGMANENNNIENAAANGINNEMKINGVANGAGNGESESEWRMAAWRKRRNENMAIINNKYNENGERQSAAAKNIIEMASAKIINGESVMAIK